MPQGNEAHVPQLLIPCPRACALQQEKPPQWEAHALQGKAAPTDATRESPYAVMKTQQS